MEVCHGKCEGVVAPKMWKWPGSWAPKVFEQSGAKFNGRKLAIANCIVVAVVALMN